jgi:predicted exporter
MTGTFFFTEPGLAALLVFGIFGTCAAILWCIFYLRDLRRKQMERDGVLDHNSFLKHAYRSWKEKYCVRITFE